MVCNYWFRVDFKGFLIFFPSWSSNIMLKDAVEVVVRNWKDKPPIKDPQIGHAGSMKESCMALYRLTASLSTYGYVWKWSIPIEPEGFWSWQQTPQHQWGKRSEHGVFAEKTSVYPENQWGCSSRIYGNMMAFQNWIGGNIIEWSPALDWAENPACPPKPLYVWRGHKKFSGRTSFKKHGCLLVCFKNKNMFFQGLKILGFLMFSRDIFSHRVGCYRSDQLRLPRPKVPKPKASETLQVVGSCGWLEFL